MPLGFGDPWREILLSQVECKFDKNKNEDSFNCGAAELFDVL